MKLAYADPPYIGYAHYYPENEEVEHNRLLAELCANYEGWALSCYSNSLKQILSMPACPNDIRIGAWVKPWASFKPGINPAYAWEPVIFWGGRKRGRDIITIRDWVSANITMGKHMIGAKPIKFCYWIFEMLGASPEDDFIDLYPGTGIVTQAWQLRCKNNNIVNLPLFEEVNHAQT